MAPRVVLLGMVLIVVPHSARSLKMLMPMRDPAEKPSMVARANAPLVALSPRNSCRSSEMRGQKGEKKAVDSTDVLERLQ